MLISSVNPHALAQFLAHAPVGGPPYSLDETGIVKGVVEAGRRVFARDEIPGEMSVDLSHVDRRAHHDCRNVGHLCHIHCVGVSGDGPSPESGDADLASRVPVGLLGSVA